VSTHHRITLALAATAGIALSVAAAPAIADQNLCGDGCDGYTPAVQVASPQPATRPVRVATQTICGDACDGYRDVSITPAIVRVSSPSGGFDWGDAGIGAAGGLMISLLGVGGIMAVSHRRTRPGESALTN